MRKTVVATLLAVAFGLTGVTLTGAWDTTQTPLINAEGHWYGAGGAINTDVTLSKANSPQALKQGAATNMTLSAGCVMRAARRRSSSGPWRWSDWGFLTTRMRPTRKPPGSIRRGPRAAII